MQFRKQDDVLIITYPDTGEVIEVRMEDEMVEVRRDTADADPQEVTHPVHEVHAIPANVLIPSDYFEVRYKATRRGKITVTKYLGGRRRPTGGRLGKPEVIYVD